MKPKEIFAYLLLLNVLLLGLVLLMPSEKVSISKHLEFSFLDLNKLLNKQKQVSKKKEIDELIEQIENQELDLVESQDTILYNLAIEHPDSSKSSLNFFHQALRKLRKKESIHFRVLHIGDSQLEGDRITSFLREKMQSRFGGMGPGIISPLEPTANYRRSVLVRQSKNWHKEAIYGHYSKNKNGAYGLGGASFIYSNYPKIVSYDTLIQMRDSSQISDSSLLDSMKTENFVVDTTLVPVYHKQSFQSAWLKASNAKEKYFQQIQLFYTSKDSVQIHLQTAEPQSFWLAPSQEPKKFQFVLRQASQEIQIQFEGPSFRLFNLSLDGTKGIAVDNFPMRGSSGLGFESVKNRWLGNQLKGMNVKLLILQFGINVVPNPQKSYGFYQRMFSAQLKAIKKAQPQLSILVIGPSDMSRKVLGVYESYPNIPLIRDAMKNAAFENGCAFWDLYENMGGKNAMKSWVERTPPLAAKDYTHFNPKGAEYIGELLFNALLNDYKNYEKINKN